MLVHLFGGASSPSCATSCVKRSTDGNKDFDAVTIATVKRNFYVNDCLKSVPTNPKAVKLVGELRELLSRGGFHLTNQISNSKELIDSVPKLEKAPSVKNLDLSENVMLTERALGVQWNVHTDTFGFKNIDKKKPGNRRGILSVTCSVYDPLGFVSPVCYLLKKCNKICVFRVSVGMN